MANITDSIVGVLASSKHIIVSSDLTGNASVTSTHPLLTLKNNNSDSHGALLRLQKDTLDEANNDVIGLIQFTANNDVGNRSNYGSIDCQQIDVSNGSEIGKIRFSVATSNTGENTEVMTIQGGTNVEPLIDSQTTINGSLKAKLYSGTDPYELSKICNIDLGEYYGYNCHILDQKHQSDINTTSTPFKISTNHSNNSGSEFLTVGSGISSGVGTVCENWIDKLGPKSINNIYVDITGLNTSGTAGHIIGKSSQTNCYIDYTSSSSIINKIKITCLEAPSGTNTEEDIDFYVARVSSGQEGTAVSALTNYKLILENGEDWTKGMVKELTSFPSDIPRDFNYLYMVDGSGASSGGTYTGGQFLIQVEEKYSLLPGDGFDSANNLTYYSWIESDYDDEKVKTNIIIDLTGLTNEATHKDMIGYNSGFVHIGGISYQRTGNIYKAVMTCLQTPAGGELDIDVYQSTSSTGTEGNLVTSLDNDVQLLDASGDWSANSTKTFDLNPSDSNYLYLTVGAESSISAGTYTAGKFLIELYGTKLSEANSRTNFLPCYDADFGNGFKMMTGSTSGNYIELCSQDPSYVCASGRKWWIETQFKMDDHDGTEFFFGIAEPECGTTDLIDISSTFAKGAGKDRVGFTKLTHSVDTITAASTHDSDGNENISLTTSLNYDTDNNVLTLGIHWDGSTKLYFYGNSRATGSNVSNTSLLYTHTVSGSNVVPTDSNNYLRLFINNGSGTKTTTINYLRGKIQLPNATSIYSY